MKYFIDMEREALQPVAQLLGEKRAIARGFLNTADTLHALCTEEGKKQLAEVYQGANQIGGALQQMYDEVAALAFGKPLSS